MKKESKVKGLSTEGNTEDGKYEDDGTSHIRLKRSSFSGKKKKELLKAKRIVKEQRRDSVKHSEEDERTRFYESFHGIGSSAVEESQENRIRAGTEIPPIDGGLKSIFEKESDADVEARKRASRLLYDTILPGALGICVDDTMITSLEMPVRPVWNAEDSSAIVDARESSYFKSYLDTLQSSHAGKLNSFELNLEVWRQLWRVVERSDLLLIVVDIRFPRLNFPTALFELIRLKPKNQSDADMLKDDSVDQTGYPKEEEARGKMSTPLGEKPIVIILNKVDLVTMEVADSWVDWFKREYAEATVIAMSSIPVENVTPYREDNTVGGRPDKSQSQFCKGMLTRRPFGELELLAAVRKELLKSMEGQEGLDPNCISFQPTHLCNDYHKTLVTLPRQPAMTEPVKQSGGPDSTEEDDEDIWSEGVDTLSVDLNADVKDQTKETSHGGGDDLNEAKNRNNRVSWLTEDIASPEIAVELSSKFTPVLTPTSSSSSTSTNTTSGILPQKTGERSAFFTIGLVGHPNAGKSSLINALAGRKVVSVSSTPGHTKHLQTIFLNQHTRFCDCPGLVFPTTGVPYPLQVLGGQVNTAQVRETFSTLAYVGMRYPLERAYSLDSHSLSASFSSSMSIIDRTKSLKEMGAAQRWSGFGLAEAYAVKRGYYTKKERPDAHRAGNEILRDLQTGKVPFAVSPPLTLFN